MNEIDESSCSFGVESLSSQPLPSSATQIHMDHHASPSVINRKYKLCLPIHHHILSQQVDPSGPLATLRGLLLSDESLANLQRWILQHWYAVLFVVLAVLVLLVSLSSPNSLYTYSTTHRCFLMTVLLYHHYASSNTHILHQWSISCSLCIRSCCIAA